MRRLLVQLVLFLSGRLSAQRARPTSSAPQESDYISAHIGEDVALPCVFNDIDLKRLYWYKQVFGQTPKRLCSYKKHRNPELIFSEGFKNSCTKPAGEKGSFNLTLTNLKYSDTATYYCVFISTSALNFKAHTVIVKSSRSSSNALVDQITSVSVRAGDSVTLNCTVHTQSCDDGGHRVSWFRDSEDSRPGLVYTHGGSDKECERKGDAQTHSCMYKLPVKNLTESQAGTYYCAVASCGHILFGNGTKLDFVDANNSDLVTFLSGSLAFMSFLVLLLTLCLCKTTSQRCSCFKDLKPSGSSTASTENDHQDTESFHYAAVHLKKSGRSRRQKTDTNVNCIYASVKQ